MRTFVSDIQNERRDALAKYSILDTPPEREYDDLVSLAANICDVPVALLALIDDERMWFKAKVGTSTSEIPRKDSFCSHAILTPHEPLVVPDAVLDKRFVDNPNVTGGLGIRFYAGVPIRNSDRLVVGTLCILDTTPHNLSQNQISALEVIGRRVSLCLELRATRASLQTANQERKLIDLTDELTRQHNLNGFVLLAGQQLLLAKEHRSGRSLWLMAVDIDDLKSINAKFGREEGSLAVQKTGEVIESTLRDSDILGRSGGDEFVAMLMTDDDGSAEAISQRVKLAFERYNSNSGKPYLLNVSIGVVRAVTDVDTTIEAVIQRAYDAVSHVKRLSKSG